MTCGQLKTDADYVRKHGEVIMIEAVYRILNRPADESYQQFYLLINFSHCIVCGAGSV